jgi:type I restriction enzyme R subunit
VERDSGPGTSNKKGRADTQGSGKSIVMVLLAKWILENNPHARVAIITDRDELDKQIEGVFTEIGEPIKRSTRVK